MASFDSHYSFPPDRQVGNEMNKLKSMVRDWLPPTVARWIRNARGGGNRFFGNYRTWQEAMAQCTGYDADHIFLRVRDAALAVKCGDAVFERDAVCFYHEEYRWETLACLLRGAAECGGELNVLDFGGALGSFYTQHRKFFSGLNVLRWGIVEQAHFVECGRREFENDVLKFYYSIEECADKMPVNVILLSGVLQYLEKPYDHLARLGKQNASYIIVDRTPFNNGGEDQLVVQKVPKRIYSASYPMRVLSAERFDREINGLGYHKIAQLPSLEGRIGAINFCGGLYAKEKR